MLNDNCFYLFLETKSLWLLLLYTEDRKGRKLVCDNTANPNHTALIKQEQSLDKSNVVPSVTSE